MVVVPLASEDGCHDDVGCTRDRSLVEKHVTTFQLVGLDFINIATINMQ